MPGYIQFSNPVSVKTSPILPTTKLTMKSLFTDNSLVCYKNHNLSYGGVGTVKNARKKAFRT